MGFAFINRMDIRNLDISIDELIDQALTKNDLHISNEEAKAISTTVETWDESHGNGDGSLSFYELQHFFLSDEFSQSASSNDDELRSSLITSLQQVYATNHSEFQGAIIDGLRNDVHACESLIKGKGAEYKTALRFLSNAKSLLEEVETLYKQGAHSKIYPMSKRIRAALAALKESLPRNSKPEIMQTRFNDAMADASGDIPIILGGSVAIAGGFLAFGAPKTVISDLVLSSSTTGAILLHGTIVADANMPDEANSPTTTPDTSSQPHASEESKDKISVSNKKVELRPKLEWIEKSKDALRRWKTESNGTAKNTKASLSFDYAHAFLEMEMSQQANQKLYPRMHQWWADLSKKLAQTAQSKTDFFLQVLAIRDVLAPYLKIYAEKFGNMASYPLGMGGNCEARYKLLLAGIVSSVPLPPDFKYGYMLYTVHDLNTQKSQGHLAFVIYHEASKQVFDPFSGTITQTVEAHIYDPIRAAYDLLRGQGFSKEEIEIQTGVKLEDLIVVPESSQSGVSTALTADDQELNITNNGVLAYENTKVLYQFPSNEFYEEIIDPGFPTPFAYDRMGATREASQESAFSIRDSLNGGTNIVSKSKFGTNNPKKSQYAIASELGLSKEEFLRKSGGLGYYKDKYKGLTFINAAYRTAYEQTTDKLDYFMVAVNQSLKQDFFSSEYATTLSVLEDPNTATQYSREEIEAAGKWFSAVYRKINVTREAINSSGHGLEYESPEEFPKKVALSNIGIAELIEKTKQMNALKFVQAADGLPADKRSAMIGTFEHVNFSYKSVEEELKYDLSDIETYKPSSKPAITFNASLVYTTNSSSAVGIPSRNSVQSPSNKRRLLSKQTPVGGEVKPRVSTTTYALLVLNSIKNGQNAKLWTPKVSQDFSELNTDGHYNQDFKEIAPTILTYRLKEKIITELEQDCFDTARALGIADDVKQWLNKAKKDLDKEYKERKKQYEEMAKKYEKNGDQDMMLNRGIFNREMMGEKRSPKEPIWRITDKVEAQVKVLASKNIRQILRNQALSPITADIDQVVRKIPD